MNYFLNVTTLVDRFMIVVLCTTQLRIEKQLLSYWDVEYSLFFLCWQCWGGKNRNLYFDWQHDWANQRPGYSQYTRLLIKYSSAEKLPCSNWGMTKILIHVPQRSCLYFTKNIKLYCTCACSSGNLPYLLWHFFASPVAIMVIQHLFVDIILKCPNSWLRYYLYFMNFSTFKIHYKYKYVYKYVVKTT